jgi:hypothetical protein
LERIIFNGIFDKHTTVSGAFIEIRRWQLRVCQNTPLTVVPLPKYAIDSDIFFTFFADVF